MKPIGGMRRLMLSGTDGVGWAFAFAAAAYNLICLPRLGWKRSERGASMPANALTGRASIASYPIRSPHHQRYNATLSTPNSKLGSSAH
jgi:hypothetical protein